MEALVKYSVLNPLASCFIPSYVKNAASNKTKVSLSSINKYVNKTEVPLSNENEHKNEKKISQNESANAVTKFKSIKSSEEKNLAIYISCPAQRDLYDSKYTDSKLLNESFYFTKFSISFARTKETSRILWTATDVTAFLNVMFVALLGFYSEKLSITYDANDFEENEDPENSRVENCNCPPMFGCIIPPDFFGNPFNLTSTCNKKCIHVSHYSKPHVSSDTEYQSNTVKDCIKILEEKSNMEQNCKLNVANDASEIDVCIDNSIENDIFNDGNMTSAIEHPMINEIDDQINVTSVESEDCMTGVTSAESDFFNLDGIMTDMEIPKEAQTIDDFHPLLDEGISMDWDEGVSPAIKKMIEMDFSPKYEPRLSFDPEELAEKKTCTPPCSVWCDSLPQAAQDTYRKFIRTLPLLDKDLSSFSRRNSQKLTTFGNPSYKRSFSANDSPKWNKENIYDFQQNLNFESKPLKRTILHSTNFNTFNKSMQNVKDDKCKTLPPFDMSRYSTFQNQRGDKSMWGPFDGADSLWQPLPDCVSEVQHITMDTPKRVRELKQRSLN